MSEFDLAVDIRKLPSAEPTPDELDDFGEMSDAEHEAITGLPLPDSEQCANCGVVGPVSEPCAGCKTPAYVGNRTLSSVQDGRSFDEIAALARDYPAPPERTAVASEDWRDSEIASLRARVASLTTERGLDECDRVVLGALADRDFQIANDDLTLQLGAVQAALLETQAKLTAAEAECSRWSETYCRVGDSIHALVTRHVKDGSIASDSIDQNLERIGRWMTETHMRLAAVEGRAERAERLHRNALGRGRELRAALKRKRGGR